MSQVIEIAESIYKRLYGGIDSDYADVETNFSELWRRLSLNFSEITPYTENLIVGLIALHHELKDNYCEWSQWAAKEELSNLTNIRYYLYEHVDSVFTTGKDMNIASDCKDVQGVLIEAVRRHRERGYIDEYEQLLANLSKVIANYLNEDWEIVYYGT